MASRRPATIALSHFSWPVATHTFEYARFIPKTSQTVTTSTSAFNGSYALDARTRDISADVLDGSGRLRILPAAYWATTTPPERGLFCVRHGVYCLVTEELVAYLREAIAGRSAIEIGAGNGVLAEALGIPATDNFMQTWPQYRSS